MRTFGLSRDALNSELLANFDLYGNALVGPNSKARSIPNAFINDRAFTSYTLYSITTIRVVRGCLEGAKQRALWY